MRDYSKSEQPVKQVKQGLDLSWLLVVLVLGYGLWLLIDTLPKLTRPAVTFGELQRDEPIVAHSGIAGSEGDYAQSRSLQDQKVAAEPVLFSPGRLASPPANSLERSSAARPTPAAEPTPVKLEAKVKVKSEPVSRRQELIVGKGDTLSGLFKRAEIPAAELYRILALGEPVKPLTRIHPGQRIELLLDEAKLPLELVFHKEETRRLRISRKESRYHAIWQEDELERRVAYAENTIQSSLFAAGSEASLSDATIMQMASIFGWDIDFALDIRKGDRFALIFEEEFRDGEKYRDGAILAAEFTNKGHSYRAVRFVDGEGKAGHYDPKGRPMRKAFLRSPVKFARISSHFNPKRRHPILHTIRAHKGTDYAAPRGTPIMATGDGKVIHAARKGGYGKTVVLQHGKRYSTLYAHMSRYGRGIKKGAKVKQGQVIGYIGTTGRSTGPHLHYEFRVDGVHKDPVRVKLPQSEPIPKQRMAEFKAQTAPLLAQLEQARETRIAMRP